MLSRSADPVIDWEQWHDGYQEPSSPLGRRLAVVQARIRDVLDTAAPGRVRLISSCAGHGLDVVGAVRDHPRAADVRGVLVEQDSRNVTVARRLLEQAGLEHIEAVEDDAGQIDAYAGAVPADLVLMCGVFGNVSDADVKRTIENAARLCAPGATVIWTRHRRSPDLTPAVRGWFTGCGFEEVDFTSVGESDFSVGTHRLVGKPQPFAPGLELFTFVR